MNKKPEIVERELWDHYSELPNPAWYEYKNKQDKEMESKDEKRIKYLEIEIAAGDRHDGYTLAGLKEELNTLLNKVKQNGKS